ncbi:uncharacterized protein MYCFIDRAFT_174747 [Pseudocercospora fijiensis CIRAD86]|uniref:Uncharacterized protein n=1 Tax=Pseudocercospora fijiensis (strain CIRAD86) TaxID=383855 RepID=M3B1K4_PSEFD|nr:uncharacterized protein MYCFIDRAFT_174747 [Pseudocercospora fijiensis CIRAD86]EME83282.1 hypothetical protein MYCFIDRAFT_174747 [Pseudocercospora fijiensis CIRAD86]
MWAWRTRIPLIGMPWPYAVAVFWGRRRMQSRIAAAGEMLGNQVHRSYLPLTAYRTESPSFVELRRRERAELNLLILKTPCGSRLGSTNRVLRANRRVAQLALGRK